MFVLRRGCILGEHVSGDRRQLKTTPKLFKELPAVSSKITGAAGNNDDYKHWLNILQIIVHPLLKLNICKNKIESLLIL